MPDGPLERRNHAFGARREGGFALITAVLLLLLISATVINTIDFSGEEYQSGGRARASTKNLYAADAGIQLGLSRLTQPRDLSAFSHTLSDGTVIESRARDEAAPKDIESVGIGEPPEGYGINIGSGYVNELFLLTVTAEAANGGVTELESKMSSLQPNSGAY
jgi:hypothetical protein